MRYKQKITILLVLIWSGLSFHQALPAANFSVSEIACNTTFPEGAESGSLKFLCAENEDFLAARFHKEGLPFDPDLVRDRGSEKCHVWYEPTIRGFRADTENSRVEGLIYDVDTLSFLVGRTEIVGDSRDVVKEILPHVERPLEITIGVNHALDKIWY